MATVSTRSPAATPGRIRRRCSSVPASSTVKATRTPGAEERAWQRPAAQLFVEHRGVAQAVAAAAVLGGQHDPGQPSGAAFAHRSGFERGLGFLQAHDHVRPAPRAP